MQREGVPVRGPGGVRGQGVRGAGARVRGEVEGLMEPRIQYAKTADGVSLAFWTLGEGMPFVQMPLLGASHIELEWRMPEWRLWYERLAEKRKLVRYDGRGFGL